MKFDGKKASLAISNLIYDGENPMTLECFVMPTVLPPYETSVIANVNKAGVGIGLDSSGRWQIFRAQRADNRQGYEYVYSRSQTKALMNQRVHIAGVVADDSISLFVDGTLMDSNAISEHVPSKYAFRIGADPIDAISVEQHFRGIIEVVRISDTVRYTADFTPEQRLAPDEHTLALYHFDEGAGVSVKDSSYYGRHTWLNGAQWTIAD